MKQVLNLCDLLDSVFGGLFYEAGCSSCHSVDSSTSTLCSLRQQAERKASPTSSAHEFIYLFKSRFTSFTPQEYMDSHYADRTSVPPKRTVGNTKETLHRSGALCA